MDVKECGNCIHWNGDRWVMSKYGEGCGICRLDGRVRFCSHPCPFCETDIKDN